jgi:pyruvate/2-oxoglutarate dehydrogenase complex dihydrolipoamide dehydrogenase (E3) component
MPSKALLHPGQALYEIRHVPGAREAADGQLGVQAVLDNRDSIISDLDDSAQVPWLEDNDISLYRHGRVTGELRDDVGDATGQQRLSQAPAPNRRVRECPFPDGRPRRNPHALGSSRSRRRFS